MPHPDVSFRDYIYRDKYDRSVGNWYLSKYVFYPDEVEYCDVHFAKKIQHCFISRLLRIRIVRALFRAIRGKAYVRNVVHYSNEGNRCPVEKGFYRHYLGLTTGWRNPERIQRTEFDSERHCLINEPE